MADLVIPDNWFVAGTTVVGVYRNLEAQHVILLLPHQLEGGTDQQEDRNRLRPRRIHQAGTPAISAAMRRAASAGSAAPVIGRPITM